MNVTPALREALAERLERALRPRWQRPGHIWSRVACRYPPLPPTTPPPHPPFMVSPPPHPNGKTRNPRKGRTFVSKVPTVTGMGPPNGGSS